VRAAEVAAARCSNTVTHAAGGDDLLLRVLQPARRARTGGAHRPPPPPPLAGWQPRAPPWRVACQITLRAQRMHFLLIHQGQPRLNSWLVNFSAARAKFGTTYNCASRYFFIEVGACTSGVCYARRHIVYACTDSIEVSF
jgi:hypothetical protein